MAKRWSKLKKEIESLFFEGISLAVHCTDMRKAIESHKYNGGQHYSIQSIGVFKVVLGKRIIWNFPNDFIDSENRETWPEQRPYSYNVSILNRIIRDYIDTPKNELFSKNFEQDVYGLTRLFLAADRRISIHKLKQYFIGIENHAVKAILSERTKSKTNLADRS
ncbi:MAG: hypothetical protein KDI65_10290 [Alphaproteobacteria bacterium]|nr:hypothetical protein [Alphaproteobacteria bacterium]